MESTSTGKEAVERKKEGRAAVFGGTSGSIFGSPRSVWLVAVRTLVGSVRAVKE